MQCPTRTVSRPYQACAPDANRLIERSGEEEKERERKRVQARREERQREREEGESVLLGIGVTWAGLPSIAF